MRWLAIVCWLLLSSIAQAAISLVQSQCASNGTNGTTFTATFPSTTTAGSVVLISGETFVNGLTLTFSNDKGDTVTDSGLGTIDDTLLGADMKMAAFFTATAGSQNYTLAWGGSTVQFKDICIWEVAGLTSARFDIVITGTGNVSAATSGSSGTLNSSNEFAAGYGVSETAFVAAGSAPWVSDGIVSPTLSLGEHQVVTSNAAIAATGTNNNGAQYRMWLATLMSGIAPACLNTRTLVGVGC